jgi:hypothetical protein
MRPKVDRGQIRCNSHPDDWLEILGASSDVRFTKDRCDWDFSLIIQR